MKGARVVVILILVTCSFSCKKFLDEKPNKALVIPKTVAELQGVLDQGSMGINYPVSTELCNDNLYFNYADWLAMPYPNDTRAYVWDANTDLTADWGTAYTRILNANIVLSLIDDLTDNTATTEQINDVKGSALFYRAINLYELAQVFAPQYSQSSANSGFGIPLKTSPNVDDITVRSTVQQTYDFIIGNIKSAIPLLPNIRTVATYSTRPSKAAGYALLSRTYLVMRNYIEAGKYADSCLQLYSTLMDYNNTALVTPSANIPFKMFNDEVIFQAFTYLFNSTTSRVDTTLFNSYATNDMRKTVFWRTTTDGWWRFKGNYNGAGYDAPFCGIATDEIWLIRAECFARNGKTNEAMADLNTLLLKRWKTNQFTPFTASTPLQALNLILTERRKELCFRPSLRWTDLRRLNIENDYAKTLKRVLNGTVYELPPNDLRYTFLIPTSVVSKSGIQQNPR